MHPVRHQLGVCVWTSMGWTELETLNWDSPAERRRRIAVGQTAGKSWPRTGKERTTNLGLC